MSNKLVVVKFGSELVTNENGVDTKAIYGYADGLCKYHGDDSLIIVTSGAVAAGRHSLKQAGLKNTLFSDQQRAQIGGVKVFAAWQEAFSKVGRLAGSLLITHHDLTLPSESQSLHMLLEKNRKDGLVSIINANDALNLTELLKLPKGADNDALASHIARFMKAEHLRLFTQLGGVVGDDKVLVDLITKQNIDAIAEMIGRRKLGSGRSGIQSKALSAWEYVNETGGIAEIAAPNPDMTGWSNTVFRTSM